jgi:YebC/PmpR family DNA-binding regulatory protein
MSGHSKWSTIKHQKETADKKRGDIFTKLTRAITVAAKQGGDPEGNFKLRLAIEKAKEANLPKDKIEAAIDRAAGKDKSEYVECVYEGYGPEGIAVIAEAMTDNKNRTFSEIKNFFEKNGGSLGGPGSVAYLFENCGLIRVDLKGKAADEAMLKIIDLGVLDVEEVEDGVEVYTEPGKIEETRKKLGEIGFESKSAELFWRPKTEVAIVEPQKQERVLNFLRNLQALDDIQEVYSNVDLVEK